MRTSQVGSTRLWIAAGIAIGLFIGINVYTFVYAKGASYLSNNPAACANCHVMNEQYGGWLKSSHHSVAGCNDCHTPHSFLPKYGTKALNGFFHSLAFTTGRFPDVIEIKQRNRNVTESACRSCHEEITSAIGGVHFGAEGLSCIRCHPSAGHLESAD